MTVLERTSVLGALYACWDDIDRMLTGVPDAQWRKPAPLPGWCVKDVVAHLIGTESMLSGIPTPEADVDVSALAHVHNAIGVMNECWVRHFDGNTAAEVLERFRGITAQRRGELNAYGDEQWTAVTATPAGPDSYGRFTRVRIFDCWMHEQDIREALSHPSSAAELQTSTASMALDELAASMGFVVGKLGRAPDGSRVAIELTGPLARTLRIQVDGKAKLVEAFDEPATTTIRLDGLQFTRMCGGRSRAPAGVEFDGDAEVGRRIVENLAYVI